MTFCDPATLRSEMAVCDGITLWRVSRSSSPVTKLEDTILIFDDEDDSVSVSEQSSAENREAKVCVRVVRNLKIKITK